MTDHRQYIENTDGNIATIFAIALVPLLICVGAAIDTARLVDARTHLQDAADIAALAAAREYRMEGEKEMKAEGKAFVEGNALGYQGIKISKINTSKTKSETVVVKANASLEPKFMQIFGYPKMDIFVTSEATLGEDVGLEIAIAFDGTNSMDFDTRWDDAMNAVNLTLADMKVWTKNENFYVSLVPFKDRVNIGTARSTWLSGAAPNNWTGCVEPRESLSGDFHWSVDNQTPQERSFDASISGVTGNLDTIHCPGVQITGPTPNPQNIINATKQMTKGGTGRFDLGMAWAWRVLSPNWQGQWGVTQYPSSDSDARRKKLIFVSDGNSNAYRSEMSAEQDWDNNQGSKVAFEHLVDLCSRIKNDGIEIYMLKVDGNPHAESYFQQCASSPSHYYRVTQASNIKLVFDDVLTELQSDLRLVK